MIDIYRNILVVESSVFTRNELDYLRKSNKIDIVRRACRNTTALISYESLPQNIKDKIGIKNPYEMVKRNLLESYIEHNVAVSEMITAAAVAVWRDKFNTEIYAGRRGTTEFRNTKTMQNKRSAPTQPLYYWTLDGWDVELMYQKTEKGLTTYHNRPTVVVVLDACLKYPIGFAIGTHETPELITAALRDAAKHTAELFGKMYRSHQIQSDRYSIKKMMPIYEGIGEKITPARAHNAKAKIIEPYFNQINKKYCQLQPNWSGFGITSDKEKQPNTEFLQKYKKNFPDFEGVKKQVSSIIEMERAQKVERMLELWANLAENKKIELSWEKYLLHFGENNGHTQRLVGSGLNVTVAGKKMIYDCFDIDFRKHGSVDWEVKYDCEDLSKALAVSKDGTLRFALEEKYIQPMALMDRQEGDSGQLQRVRNYNKSLEEYVTDFRATAAETLQEAQIELPEMRDTLKKLLITDSNGQHKNRKSEMRLQLTSADIYEDNNGQNERLEYLKRKVDMSEYLELEYE